MYEPIQSINEMSRMLHANQYFVVYVPGNNSEFFVSDDQ